MSAYITPIAQLMAGRIKLGDDFLCKPKPEIAKPWTQQEAISLCVNVEAICPQFGCHVALTGGLLYKQGTRKDCDLVFYRIRQIKIIYMDGLWKALNRIGLVKVSGRSWCYKAVYEGKNVDCLFPEEQASETDSAYGS